MADSRYAGNGRKDRSEKLLLLPSRGDAAAAILVLLPSRGPNALTVQKVSSLARSADFRQGLWDAAAEALYTSDNLFWENDSIRQGAHNTAGARPALPA